MKKLTAVLLALVMMTLPVLGLAASPDELLQAAVDAGRPLKVEGQLTLGAIPGLDAETAAIAKEVVDAISFTSYDQENQGSFTLKLANEDVLYIAAAGEGEDTYLSSNLLGGTVAFNAEEGKVIMEYLMNLAVASGMMTEEDLAEIKDAIAQATAQITAPVDEVNMEDMDLTGVITVVMEVAAKVQTGEVTQQPKNCDPAASTITLTLTGEDIGKIYTEIFKLVKDVPQFMQALSAVENLSIDGQPVTAEEFAAKLPEMGAKMGEMIQGDIPVVIYLDAEGNPVYGTMAMTMTAEGDTVSMDINYARLTVNEGVTHAVNVIAKDDKAEGAAISVNVLESETKDVVNVAVAALEGETSVPVVNVDVKVEKEYGETESEEDVDVVVTITDPESQEAVSCEVEVESKAQVQGEDVICESDIDLSIMGMEELLCIKLVQTTGAGEASIVSADAVRPGKMTEEEFNTYVNEDVMNALMSTVMGLMSNPALQNIQ